MVGQSSKIKKSTNNFINEDSEGKENEENDE